MGKEILMINPSTLLIEGVFKSAADAENCFKGSNINISRKKISDACVGYTNMHAGYYWRFKTDIIDNYIWCDNDLNCDPLLQFNLMRLYSLRNYSNFIPFSYTILPGEVFRDVEGYVGLYKVSNYGRVLSYQSYPYVYVLKNTMKSDGYLKVDLVDKDGVTTYKLVHRLVADAFIDKIKDKPHINHIDEVKSNNNVDNLELTQYELDTIELLYNSKIKHIKYHINIERKYSNRNYVYIVFDNKLQLYRQLAAWRAEVKYGRLINSSRLGGDETVDHIDGDSTNDHPDNLQILTNSENVYKAKPLSYEIVTSMRDDYYKNKMFIADIADKYNYDDRLVHSICMGHTYRNFQYSYPKGFKNLDKREKLSKKEVLDILNKIYNEIDNDHLNITELSNKYGIKRTSLSNYINNRRKDIDNKIIVGRTHYIRNNVNKIRDAYYIDKREIKDIANQYNIGKDTCSNIVRGLVHKDIHYNYPESRSNTYYSNSDIMRVISLYNLGLIGASISRITGYDRNSVSKMFHNNKHLVNTDYVRSEVGYDSIDNIEDDDGFIRNNYEYDTI